MSKYERESIRRAGQVPQWVLMRPRRQGRWGESSPDTAALGWLPGGKEPPRVLNYGLGRGVEGSSMQTARRRCAIPFKNLVLRPERWREKQRAVFWAVVDVNLADRREVPEEKGKNVAFPSS